MTVRYFTGDVTNVDLSEFLSIESSGPYNEMCSTCRKDEDLGIIQTILSALFMALAAWSMIHNFSANLVSSTSSSTFLTIFSIAAMLAAFWFFMPREGGDHRYIRAWSKLPFIGPKLMRNVALSKIAYKEEIEALYSMHHKSTQGAE